MFGQAKDKNASEGEIRQPLLNNDSQQNLAEEGPVFSVDEDSDDEELEEHSAFETPKRSSARSVTFREDVQVIAPSLRSTIESREAGA